MSKMDGVVSAIPNRKLKLHTTRSWDFTGLTQGKLEPGQVTSHHRTP